MVGWVWVPALGLASRAGTVVAVVERGGFLWFYEFLFDFVAFIYFFGPGILLHGDHSHWLTDGGTLGF